MPANVEGWLKRAEEMLQTFTSPNGQRSGEALQFAISMASALYGPNSPQVEMIKSRADASSNEKGYAYPHILIYEFAFGAIKNMVEEIKGGLIQSVRLGIAGEVLADLIAMAREALSDKAIGVAAVLSVSAA